MQGPKVHVHVADQSKCIVSIHLSDLSPRSYIFHAINKNITLCFSLHSVFHGFKATTMSAIFEPVCLGAVSRQLDIWFRQKLPAQYTDAERRFKRKYRFVQWCKYIFCFQFFDVHNRNNAIVFLLFEKTRGHHITLPSIQV